MARDVLCVAGVLAALLACGRCNIWVQNKSGKLPLELATREGEVRAVEVLVQHMEGMVEASEEAGVCVEGRGGEAGGGEEGRGGKEREGGLCVRVMRGGHIELPVEHMKEQRRPAWMQMGVAGGGGRKRGWVGWREGCVKGGGRRAHWGLGAAS